MNRLAVLAGCVALALSAQSAVADEVYRCGPTGAEYSQTPCERGLRIDVADARTDEQYAQARALAEKTKALGLAMERERLAAEAAYRPARAGSFNSPAAPTADDAPPRSKAKRLRSKAPARPKLAVIRLGARP